MFLSLSWLDAYSADIHSKANGNWGVGSSWTSDPSLPALGDNVFIDDVINIPAGETVEINNLTISPDGKLVVEGTLIVNGTFTMEFSGNNESEFEMGANSMVVIKNDVVLTNKVSLNLSSYFIVYGDFTKSGSSNQGSLMVDDAKIYVMGTVLEPWPDFTACDGNYDGNTSNGDSGDTNCDVGNFQDLIDHVDPVELPAGIYDDIVDASTISANTLSSSSSELCSGSSVDFTISDGSATSISWYLDDNLISGESGLIYAANSIGTYSALYLIGTSWYQTNEINLGTANLMSVIDSPVHSSITGSTATLGGNITNLGCTDVVERGIYYSTTDGFTDGAGTKISETSGLYSTGAFSVSVSSLSPNTVYYYKAFSTNSDGSSYTSQGSFTTLCGGDASVFGDGEWRVHAYNGRDLNLGGGTEHRGYYTEPSLTFDSRQRWGVNSTPSAASGYVGCSVGNDNHTVVYKRTNFPCGNYTIDIRGIVNAAGHDDEARLYVNGTQEWSQTGWGGTYDNVWSGKLDASSTIEYRVAEGGGESYGALRITSTTLNPSIDSPTHQNIGETSAGLGGNITDIGCSDITERGIYYSTTSGFADGSGTKVSETSGPYTTGIFTMPVSGLSSAAAYYYKAFATNSEGVVYSSQGTFATLVPAPDTDGDGVIDANDEDDDNDGITDCAEKGLDGSSVSAS